MFCLSAANRDAVFQVDPLLSKMGCLSTSNRGAVSQVIPCKPTGVSYHNPQELKVTEIRGSVRLVVLKNRSIQENAASFSWIVSPWNPMHLCLFMYTCIRYTDFYPKMVLSSVLVQS